MLASENPQPHPQPRQREESAASTVSTSNNSTTTTTSNKKNKRRYYKNKKDKKQAASDAAAAAKEQVESQGPAVSSLSSSEEQQQQQQQQPLLAQAVEPETAPVNMNVTASNTQQQQPTTTSPLVVPVEPSYHDIICSHLYHSGFVNGLYSDCTVRIQAPNVPEGSLFKLHQLIMIRSPYLASVLQQVRNQDGSDRGQSLDFTLSIHDPNVTLDGLFTVIGHLYASFAHQALLNPSPDMTPKDRSHQLRSVLATSHLFQVVDLSNMTLDLIQSDIRKSNVIDYCHFVSSEWAAGYGHYSIAIREFVENYLCKGVTKEISVSKGLQLPLWSQRNSPAYQELVALFSELPFEWLKKIVESKNLDCPTDIDRFHFAKQILATRSSNRATLGNGNLVVGDENVLLAFIGENKSGVTLVRKMPRPQVQAQHPAPVQAPAPAQQPQQQQQPQQPQQQKENPANDNSQSAFFPQDQSYLLQQHYTSPQSSLQQQPTPNTTNANAPVTTSASTTAAPAAPYQTYPFYPHPMMLQFGYAHPTPVSNTEESVPSSLQQPQQQLQQQQQQQQQPFQQYQHPLQPLPYPHPHNFPLHPQQHPHAPARKVWKASDDL